MKCIQFFQIFLPMINREPYKINFKIFKKYLFLFKSLYYILVKEEGRTINMMWKDEFKYDKCFQNWHLQSETRKQ